MFFIFASIFWSLNFSFSLVLGGPGGFRKVREVKRKNVDQFAQNRSGGFRAMTKNQKKFTTILIPRLHSTFLSKKHVTAR